VPIQGSIEEAGLPDVLQLLSLGRKTGCLTVVDGAMHGEIYLDVGRVSFATIANRRDRLGVMLVKSGRITQEQLNAAAEEQEHGNKRQIGKILVDSGRIDRRSIERFVRLQVEEAVYFLFTWKQGEFTFTSHGRPPQQSLLVSLDPESLLLEGARRVDEWSLIQKKIPSFDLVYQRTKNKLSGAAAEDLTDEQNRILPLLDGTRDVAGLVDVTGMNEFDVGKALYGLVVAGVAQLVERRSRVRHLDYRELLAYVVREAEFADPQRRKDAARHIVDCLTCAERLRKIHVRRTEGSDMIAAAAEAGTPAATRATARPPQLAPPAVPHSAAETPGFMERRLRSRRTNRDRRRFERRAGLDRRQVVNAAWAQSNVERRKAPRRQDERRGSYAPDRRSGVSDRRAGAVTVAAPVVRAAGPGERMTEPRQLQPLERRGQGRPHRAGPAADDRKTLEATPVAARAAVAAQASVAAPAARAAAPFPAEPPSPPEATSPPGPESPPAPGRTGAPSREIQWIMSPEESLELIRASKTDLRAIDAAPRASARTTAVPAARTTAAPAARTTAAPAARTAAAPAARTTAAPAAKAASEPQPPGPNGRATAARPVAATAAAPPAALPTFETRPAPSPARPAESGREERQAFGRRAFPVRTLAIAASFAGVALVGYVAGQLGRRGTSGQAAETTAANALPATAAAQAPPRTRAREDDPRAASPAAPVQSAPRTAAPAEQRVPTPSAAETRAEQPPRPAAEPRSVGQEPVPRAAPGPVVAAAQPPAAQLPAAQPAAPIVAAPPPQPAPTVGILRGVVRDASGRTLAGARVSVRGTTLSAVTDGSGAFEIRDVADGPVVVQATAQGYVPGSTEARARAGAAVTTDLTLGAAPTAAEPDRELSAGGWTPVGRAEATEILGGTLGAIEGLGIESIAKSTAGSRPRVRVVQVAGSGERIVLTETRAGAAVRGGAGPARLTSLRVMPPSEAYPLSTGTASLGNLLITARSGLAADALRSLLERLGEVR